jgi:hypothetical protein
MVTQAPNTGSTLYGTATGAQINKTSTAISTNIIIMVNDRAVGAVQSMAINEKRAIKMVDEVGTDGHIDSVPVSSTNITGTCQRIRFDRLRVAEAFSRGFIHVASQVYPFDIVVLDKQKRNAANQISTVIKNVWISGISYTYQADNWIITDNMEWEAETIYSFLNNGQGNGLIGQGTPVAQGGEIGVVHMGQGGSPPSGVNITSGDGIVNIEQLVDTGASGRRGSLDAAGLIDLGSDSSLF